MSLYRIHKEADTPFDAYTEEQTRLIKEWYETGELTEGVQSLLKKCWEEHTWLQCDCRSDYAPIMHVRRVGNDYHIVRMSRYGKHDDACAFSSKPFIYKKSKSESSTKEKRILLKELLIELIYQAELNQIPLHAKGYGRPLTVQYDHLKSVAGNVFGELYENHPELFVTHPNGLFVVEKELKTLMEAGESNPVGYLFTMADSIKGSVITLHSKGKDIEITCAGECFIESEDYDGPWVGLIDIKEDPQTEKPVPMDAVFMPAMRKSLLCPLRPDDQKLLNYLVPLQELAEAKNKRLLVTKYLPNDDHYHEGLSVNVRCGYRSVDVAILHAEEGRESLPKGALYHMQPSEGEAGTGEQFLLNFIQKRLDLT